jgi:hypothetical protein
MGIFELQELKTLKYSNNVHKWYVYRVIQSPVVKPWEVVGEKIWNQKMQIE